MERFFLVNAQLNMQLHYSEIKVNLCFIFRSDRDYDFIHNKYSAYHNKFLKQQKQK